MFSDVSEILKNLECWGGAFEIRGKNGAFWGFLKDHYDDSWSKGKLPQKIIYYYYYFEN